MWPNYIKPILKTNLIAIVWAFSLSFIIFFISSFLIGVFTGSTLTEIEEVYLTIWYQVYEFILGTTIAIVVDYKAAIYLFKQETVNKTKLLNVYLITGVIATILITAWMSFNSYYEQNTIMGGLILVIDTALYVFVTKHIFANKGRVDYKNIFRI